MRSQECPQCRWVSVDDGTGRRRLEMRWAEPGTGTALSPTGPAVAARAA